MNVFFDSSALVKVFVNEPGTSAIQSFFVESLTKSDIRLIVSVLTKAEIMAAFAALRRGRFLSQRQFEEAASAFRKMWPELSVPHVTVGLIERSGDIGLNCKIKGADAFQLASALEVESDLFISTDLDLNLAAEEHGLSVWNPMIETTPKITLP